MSSRELRNKLKKYIDEADDDVVKMIYSMFESEKEEDWWDKLPKEVQNSILKAEKELKEGKGIPHEEVMKKYKKWFTR